MGRQVRKGEKALWILAPITARRPRPDADGALDADDLAGHDTPAPDRGGGHPARRPRGCARVPGRAGL